jgi:hypothetical protein
MTSTEVALLGIGVSLFIAVVVGTFTVTKLILNRFGTLSEKITTSNEKTADTIALLRENQAVQAARVEGLETFVKTMPQLLAQLLQLTVSNPPVQNHPHSGT